MRHKFSMATHIIAATQKKNNQILERDLSATFPYEAHSVASTYNKFSREALKYYSVMSL